MRTWSTVMAVLASAAFAVAAFAATPGSFQVSATLSHAGQPFAAPSAVVRAGEPASIEVTGADGYTLTLTVTDVAPDEIRVVARLDSAYGSMEPTIVVRPGQPASVAAGDVGLELTVRRDGAARAIGLGK
ncbi:hypothetical protein [Dokdonella sp.]|uniref:hypothetical protein n=1 Tax=Dokdonella sp. TaxID=2291710 RepID=UPI002F401FAF